MAFLLSLAGVFFATPTYGKKKSRLNPLKTVIQSKIKACNNEIAQAAMHKAKLQKQRDILLKKLSEL